MIRYKSLAGSTESDTRRHVLAACQNSLRTLASSDFYDVVTDIFDEEFASQISRPTLLPIEDAVLEKVEEILDKQYV